MTTTGAVLIGLVGVLLGGIIGFALHWFLAERWQRSERAGVAHELRLDESRLAAQDAQSQKQLALFQNAATEALAQNNNLFLSLAEQTLQRAGDSQLAALAAREQEIAALFRPLHLSLHTVAQQVGQMEQRRAAGESALITQMREVAAVNAELRRGTNALVTALSSSQARGYWGELQLRRIVEAAGMLERVDFTPQVSVQADRDIGGESKALRPDLVIHLAGGKSIVVDAKAPLPPTPAQQPGSLPLGKRLRAHVDALAAKRYWEQFSATPDFVVLFVPVESLIGTALATEPDLLEYAAARNVLLASPMTLLAMLRAVAYGWREDALAGNAAEVLAAGRQLHGRLKTFAGHLQKVGAGLTAATKAYNQTLGSLESSILPAVRRMEALQVSDQNSSIPDVSEVSTAPRKFRKPELAAPPESSRESDRESGTESGKMDVASWSQVYPAEHNTLPTEIMAVA